jgi:patatin-like phospholipase/acyl hydrolase
VLARFFGTIMFRTALTPLLISSYDLQGQIPYFFKSHKIHTSDDYDWKVADIARATSAAPTYFPPHHLTNSSEDLALVDGGVYVNNLAVAAYAEARALYLEASQFVVIAVGTGNRQDNIRFQQAKNWGLICWATKIISVFMDSVSEAVDYELEHLPECTFFRLQPPDLGKASNQMDDVEPGNLNTLQDVAQDYLASNQRLFTSAANSLRDGRGDNMPGTGR